MQMNSAEQDKVLQAAKNWFRNVIVVNHIQNTRKLANASEFNINPFLTPYLAGFFGGKLTSHSLALALLYPRVLGTSITTSFGQNMQSFISDVLKGSFGSMIPGIDIEFVDALDGRQKYCQAKLGPNTINKDDIDTVDRHFKAARNLARTNKLAIQQGDFIIGILYGENGQESSHYQTLSDDRHHEVLIGKDFWHHLTGAENFYRRLIDSIADVAGEANGSKLIEEIAEELASKKEIRRLAGEE